MNLSLLVSSTIGKAVPKYRTLDQWSGVYRKVIAGRQINEKTRANRRCSLNHIITRLGADRLMSSIRPHDISGMVMAISRDHPQLAKRVLIETKDCFNEALNYDWITRNPAINVKPPKVRVQRHRLTLDQWWLILGHAVRHMPPWVCRMLALALITGQRRSDLVKMRFSDVWDGHLHVEQVKTGMRLALPLALRLNAVDLTLGDVIDDCRGYAAGTEFMLRKHNGEQLGAASLSARFETAREAVIRAPEKGIPPSLHECRSLSERLYRAQGINTMVLLGHRHQSMTDMYNDDRGLSHGQWKTLTILEG